MLLHATASSCSTLTFKLIPNFSVKQSQKKTEFSRGFGAFDPFFGKRVMKTKQLREDITEIKKHCLRKKIYLKILIYFQVFIKKMIEFLIPEAVLDARKNMDQPPHHFVSGQIFFLLKQFSRFSTK